MVIHLQERSEKKLKGAVLISFVVGFSLLVIKFAAYFLTKSNAILSDATESIVNVVSAAVAFYSMRMAIKPPDEKHPYGHGKAEFFSAAFEGAAIIIAAFWIIYKAISELITGPEFHKLDLGLLLIVGATLANTLLGLYLLRQGKKNSSLILIADGKHVLTDVFTSAGVVVGLVTMYFTDWYFLDALIAIVVALFIIKTGWELLKKAAGGMMDESSLEDEKIIKGVLASEVFSTVCGFHKIRHRHSGCLHFVDFHLIFPRHFTIDQAHEIATAVETKIAIELGDASVMAHIEPCKRTECPHCRDRKPL